MKIHTGIRGALSWPWLPLFLLLLNSPSSRQENLRPGKANYGPGTLPHLVYYLPEESPRGTIIAKLRDDIETMLGEHQPVSPQSLQITNWQDRGPRHFGIEPNSGYLIVNAQPNREALCPDNSLPTGFSLPSLVQPGPVDGKFGGSSSSQAGKGGHQRMTSPAAPDRPCSLLLRVVFAPQQQQPASGSAEREESSRGALEPILLSVTVVVTDVNDHAPAFPQSRISFELGETSAVPETTIIILPMATDPDAGENGTISYWLEERPGGAAPQPLHRVAAGYSLRAPNLAPNPWNATFPFRLEGPYEGGQPLQLRLISALDYEKVKSYDFVLHAEDHGRPKVLSSQLAIHIDVLDENDNPPIFERIHNFVIINESLPRGSVLLDLRATDADSSRNGQVSFEIPMAMTEEENMVKQYFEVRTVAPGYAKLYLRQPLDLDQDAGADVRSLGKLTSGLGALDGEDLSVRRSRDYHIRIQAIDNGSPRRQSADAYVTVRVLDVNDMVPRISISYINTATHPQQTGDLSQMPPGASSAASSALYSSSVQRGHGVIPENTERRFLALVTVQDLDSGPWGQVRCKTDNDAFQLVPIGQQRGTANGVLEAPQTGYFGGDATGDPGGGTGAVSANQEITFKLMAIKAFDREEVEQITFRVLCVDNFVKSGQLQTFVENLQPPESVTKQQPEGTGAFGSSFLSRHPGAPYTVVTDRAKRLTGTATVSVRILDENDCVPEFTQPLYSFSVDENVPEFGKHSARKLSEPVAGHPIGTIRAVDRDLNSRLTYQLQSNPLEAFALDAQTGVLTVVRPFDREALFSSTYEGVEIRKPKETSGDGAGNESTVVVHLAASVSDGLHSANTQIQVVILDVNDCPPVFERSNYEFYVQENERPSPNQPVGRVLARDADAGFNGRILYRLDAIGQMGEKTSANGTKLARDYNPIRFFKIDRDSGTLHTLRPLDREQYSHHIFYVLAIDTSNKAHYQMHPLAGDSMWSRRQYHSQQQQQQKQPNHFTATATVTVIVTDVNDNAPTISFPTPHSTLAVEAGAPAGQHIFTVAASDPDLGENSTIRFTLRQSTLTVSDSDASARTAGSKTAAEVAESMASSAKLGGGGGVSSVFSIDEHAGIVFLTDKLPNKAAKHLLIIGAHDLGSVQKNTSVAAIINVVQKTSFDPSLLLDLGSQSLKNEQPELMGPHSERLGPAQSNKYSPHQPMGQQQQLQQQQQQQQHQRPQQHHSRDRELTQQGDQGISPVYMFTDRVIIFVLSAIFVVLLIVTMVLIFLIRRRRFMEMHAGRTNKDHGKPQVRSNMEGPVLQCNTNSLQLIQADGAPGTAGKTAVFYRKDVPSDVNSQADSDGRSGLGTDSYPQQTLIASEDSYTLLKTLGRNQMTAISAGELAPSVCKAYGHCVPLTSFAPVVQVNNGIPTRGTYLGQPIMQGFGPIFPMPAKIASTGGYVSMPKQGTAGGGGVQTEVGRRTASPDQLIFAPQFISPKRTKPSGQQSPFNELPNFLPGLEEGRRSEYQKLIQLKTGPLVGRVSNLRHPQKDHEHGISGSDLEGNRWPSSEDIEANDEDETEEEDEGRLAEAMNSQDHRRSSFRMKAATLQALHRSTSSDWHLPNNATPCDVQQQKFVKFSTSNISLNKLPSSPIRQNPTESHYV